MQAGRHARTALAVAAATLVVIAGPFADPASAAPTPTPTPTPSAQPIAAKIKDAKAQVEELEKQVSEVGEDYEVAAAALEENKDRLKSLKSDISRQQKLVDTLAEQVRVIALRQFQNRDVDTTVQIFTSGDPDTLLDRLSTANKVDQDMTDTLAQHEAEQANLTDMTSTADAEVAALAEQEQKLAAMKKDLQDKVDAAQALVLQLTDQQRAELEAAEGGRSTFDASELDETTVNAKIIAAIKYATSKVPNGQYVWGSSGPTGFDCSGLMLAAYRSVGIGLPHSSRAQSNVGRAVSKDELKPGDLIFWYHPIHHVGMYIGNGKIVHARNTRSDLVIQTLASYPAPWAGARRVIG
ncbi:MAG TPA: NlpC/P60 family protein [Propionicimonas sp.]|nr:NlpC/P60 family protein [Propionicimonas sp.]